MRVARFFGWILAFVALGPVIAHACPDNHYRDSFGICWPKGPKVPSIPTPGQILNETQRFVQNLGRELGKTPQALQQCVQNLNMCVNEVISAPLALPVQAYLEGLYRQSEGRVRSFPPSFIALVQRHYGVDLSGVTYADNINTGHGMTVAYCDRIFFAPRMVFWKDKEELRLVLHEFEHIVQCQRRGQRTYLAEYILKGAADIVKSGRLNTHDLHDYEQAANRKANSLTDSVWASLQQVGGTPGGSGVYGSRGGVSVATMANACTTPAGACVVAGVPVGAPCYCPSPSGPMTGVAQQRQVGAACYTNFGSCMLGVPLFRGDRCYCPTYSGPVWGLVN